METNYDNYSKELKDYIQFSCPYKIGDYVRVHSLYRSYNNADNEVSHHCKVIDVQVSTKRQILFRNGLGDIIKELDNRQELLDEPVPEFTITYVYTENVPKPKEDQWKFWQTTKTQEVTSSIIIDSYGNNVQRTGSVRKTIEKE